MGWYTRSRPGGWWPTLITLLGAFLRWHRLGDERILWDHAYPVAQGIRLLQTGAWPSLGQPTTFFLSNPPGQAYFSLLPQFFGNSFWLTFWFITTLNVLAVPLLYRLTRGLLSERTALVAAFLYAVSPWVVEYSRGSWSSALLPVGDVLVLGLLLHALEPHASRKNTTMLAMFASLALLGQTYFLALVLVPMQAAGIVLARWRAIPWRGLLWGAVLFGLGLALYAAAVAANLPAQRQQVQRLSQGASAPAAFVQHALQAVGFGLSYVTGQGFFDGRLAPWLARPLEWALGLALALGVARAAVRLALRRPGAWVEGALLLWWVIPVAVLTINNQPLFSWHLRTTLPAGQVLAAMGISWLARRWPRTRPGWVAAGAGLGAVLSGGLAAASFSALQLTALSNAAQPGPPRDARLDQITLNASTQMGAVLSRAMSTYGVNELYSDLPDVVPTAWTGRSVNTVSWTINNQLLIIPDNRPALYLRTAWGTPPDALPGSHRVEVVTWPGQAFTALDLFPALDWAAEARLPDVLLNWPSDSGLTLLGYTLNSPLRGGQTSTVTTYWRINSLPDTRGQFIFGPYLHLVSRAGALAVNVSAPGLPGYYYRLGDLYIETIQVPIPGDLMTGTYHMDLGLYDGLHTVGTTFHPAGQGAQPFYRTQQWVQ